MTTGVFSFGAYRFKLPSGELRKHGVPLRLSGHSLSILCILLEKPGEIVTREEIQRRLWPGDTFVDFDHGLNTAMKKLRAVLGDTADEPRFIETVPRLGYRFIAAVEFEDGAKAPEVVEEIREIKEVKELKETSETAEPNLAQRHAFVKDESVAQPVAGAPDKERGFPVRRVLVILAFAAAVAAIAWIVHREGVAEVESASRAPNRVMLAVLPFDNLTGDGGKEYVSDGMTEELITELGSVQPERLGVIARTSVMGYKHSPKRVDEIGRDLGVGYVLEGSLRQAGDHVRITAQLIRVSDQAHLWAQEFDSAPSDVLMMEENVARKIAAETRVRLERPGTPPKERAVNPEAYELYLRGRYFWNQRTDDGLRRAIEYFQQAIEKDPGDARSYAGLADAYLLAGSYLPPEVANEKAREAAKKALELNPLLAEAHISLGAAGPGGMWDWPGKERELLRGIALKPNYATGHHWYGDGYLSPVGRVPEALAEMLEAERLDPLSPIIGTDVAKQYYFLRRYDDALAQLRKVQEFSPNYPPALEWTRWVEFAQGRYADALATLEKEKSTLAPARYLLGRAIILGSSGQKAEARNLISQAIALSKTEYVNPGEVAVAYSRIGDMEKAFEWLDQAYREQSAWLTGLKISPMAEPFRGDPRFDEMVRRTGLE